ncbi:MAG: co-chaperone GroES [Patescibacteria group bacterium]|jgi:chaperonin GroES
MANKIKPLFSYVLIKPVQGDTTTASGIIIPDSAKEKPQMGEVIAVGEGFGSEDGRENKIVVKVGQKVMYKKWGGNEVKVDGQELLLVEQKDIMAIVE